MEKHKKKKRLVVLDTRKQGCVVGDKREEFFKKEREDLARRGIVVTFWRGGPGKGPGCQRGVGDKSLKLKPKSREKGTKDWREKKLRTKDENWKRAFWC